MITNRKDLHPLLIKNLTIPGEYTFRPQVSKISPWENFNPIIKNVELNLDLVSDTDLLFWSDTHFFHKNIIQYSDRPFMDVDDMNEQLVNNFNEVATHDTVSIWVGDVSFKGVIFTNELLDRCKGYKILVVGNHDFNRGKLQVYNFDEIHSIIQLNDYIITHHHGKRSLTE